MKTFYRAPWYATAVRSAIVLHVRRPWWEWIDPGALLPVRTSQLARSCWRLAVRLGSSL